MRRTSARRAGAVAVIAAGALLVSGCGSSDENGGKDGADKPEASASTSPTESAQKPDESSEKASGGAGDGAADDGQDGGSGQSGGESGKAGKLAGVWKAKGKQYVITVVGDKVTLLRERGRNCTGTLGAGRTMKLTCPSGGDESRTDGTVKALKGKTITVSWKGGPTEDYARVTDVPVKLPEDQ